MSTSARLVQPCPHCSSASSPRTLPDDLDAVTVFLTGKHPALLHGVGPATARTLASYGLDSIDKIAAAPLGTLQRILGTTAGHRLHTAARGIDPTPVTATAPPRSLTVEHPFPHDELGRERQRAALVGLSDRLGLHLRAEAQTTRTLTARYADRTTTTRTLTLPEPTAHTDTLIIAAHTLHGRLALQRARLRALVLRADGLVPAEHVPRQLLLDPADEQAHRVETAADAVRRRFGPDSARRAGGTAAPATPASAPRWTGPSATSRIPGSGSR
ncbi:DinB/UmuC family translesion DNA polymerase [Streptomyces acidiscabies]|uniref:DinB/UmuC family translesion DNA polymerase n=1 Tax=Streptomyces acidiscabies TaxID=42234 RepID=UPI000AAED3BE|nr:hypothetical protein [Streptomyces acidiscabies]